MAAKNEDHSPADPVALMARLMWLWPRLGLAISHGGYQRMREVTGLDYSLIDYQGLWSAASRFALASWLRPTLAFEAQVELLRRGLAVWEHLTLTSEEPWTQRSTPDKRFSDKVWREDPALRALKEFYLLYCDWVLTQVRKCTDLSGHEKRKLEFYTRQWLSALAPTNFAMTNPKVCTRAFESNGASLVEGLAHLVIDLENGKGLIPITQSDPSAFVVGRDIAITPGVVVYRNDLMELIQYAPRTDTVFKRPLLFVPPWINKYYVLDLRPQNSFFRWLIDQGHTVFVISWVNPDERHTQKGFDAYLREGPLAAIRIVQRITGEDEINLGGFCIGGMLAVCTLAYLAAVGNVPVRSATLLATMVDLTEIGDASVFIDEAQLRNIEKHTRRTGFLGGHHMRDMFSLLRENDLIWNYVVSSYLMGRDPPPFDILHWNSDSTHLPARMLRDFLRDIYMENSLVQRGTLQLAGQAIDVRRIKTPCYFLSTIDDHISPWRACYPATQFFSGPVTFVLGKSGHIAGVINPPSQNKYGYWTGSRYPEDPDLWHAEAEPRDGSWWPHWASWLAPHGGERVQARPPGRSNEFPALAEAPGHYVLAK
ncbi:MAG TPA: class I poly(R)-hydroxyalkanoic acid synthase [Hyphomicrobiaceae bacterium]|nr:class I poly(R)-hydroxyalkanoic acid synthase [Hyphomicrobiaceae bacterium]